MDMQVLETGDLSGWASVGMLLLAVLAVVGLVTLFIAALVSVVKSPRLMAGGKLVWIVVVFCFPFLGPLVWFLWGRHVQTTMD